MAEYRKKAGLTQTQLAEYLGISQNTLSQYETGKRNPDIKTVEMLADYFSTSINGILGIKDPRRTPREINQLCGLSGKSVLPME